MLRVYVELWRVEINNIMRIVKYEYDKYFKLWIWIVWVWYYSKYECVKYQKLWVWLYSSFLILVGDLWYVHNIKFLILQLILKILSVYFWSYLETKNIFRDVENKATKYGRALFPLLNRNKLLLYKSCIRPILTYCCPVWWKMACKTDTKKGTKIRNKN